jgi:hypothetical protein
MVVLTMRLIEETNSRVEIKWRKCNNIEIYKISGWHLLIFKELEWAKNRVVKINQNSENLTQNAFGKSVGKRNSSFEGSRLTNTILEFPGPSYRPDLTLSDDDWCVFPIEDSKRSVWENCRKRFDQWSIPSIISGRFRRNNEVIMRSISPLIGRVII